jgi:hypothetical protein
MSSLAPSPKFTSRLPTSPLIHASLYDNLPTQTTMADLPGDNGTKEPVAPPKKRSLFNKSAIERAAEADKAIDFFSRAKDIYPQRLAEEERRRQKKIMKLERKRSSASAEIKDPMSPGGKKRKVSIQKEGREGQSSDSAGELDQDDERSWNRR